MQPRLFSQRSGLCSALILAGALTALSPSRILLSEPPAPLLEPEEVHRLVRGRSIGRPMPQVPDLPHDHEWYKARAKRRRRRRALMRWLNQKSTNLGKYSVTKGEQRREEALYQECCDARKA